MPTRVCECGREGGRGGFPELTFRIYVAQTDGLPTTLTVYSFADPITGL